jgi:hypothetical protein
MSVQAISAALTITDVTASEKLLLLVLANYCDESFRCFPSQARLARETCLSDRTIRSTLVALEAKGRLTRVERSRPDGSRSTDLITLQLGAETISGGAEAASGGVGKPFPGGAEAASGLTTFEPSSNHQEEPSEKRALVRASRNDGFERFWSAYPSKVGKRDAEKAYAKAVKRIDSPDPPGVMLAAIERAAQGRRWLEGYIPNPSTWLNQDRWEDQPDERSDHQLQRPTDARRADTESRRNAWAEVLAERDGLQPEPYDGGTPGPDGNGPRYLRLAHTG